MPNHAGKESSNTLWTSSEGVPFPLGVSWNKAEQAYNFALYSKYAESVTLLLYKADDLVTPVGTYQLDYLKNKSGSTWHCRIAKANLHGARFYAYSIDGPGPEGQFEWNRFDSAKILLDPYAKSIYFPSTFDRSAAMRPGSNAGKAPLGLLHAVSGEFDWDGDKHPRHESDTVIYEVHVRGFTNNPNSGVGPTRRGTYSGLIDKIPYLKELGVTVVELMPIFQFDPADGDYWGYMPVTFFAPHQGFASTCDVCDQHNEFRAMVKALHEANMEVILDVVYNHTAEGDQRGPIYNFKGIDNSTYYLLSGNPNEPYQNFSGAGNTLHCSNAAVRRMIVDSLRHWTLEMHVDGFRFDLASIFTRNDDGSLNLNEPPILSDIVGNPALAKVRLIAEPWDAGGAYELGRQFPAVSWFQWNGKFRDDIRQFVRSDAGFVPALMQRLYGSDDLFPDDKMNAFHAYQSVNFITAHDGFTLYDLVSYDTKRNMANGQGDTDGSNDNYSWNCGSEGDDGLTPEVLQLRKRQIKNFCCLLFLANGTPMLRAGDEFMQTQGGNNNPYNQDNTTSWLDWSRLQANQDIFRFFKCMIQFRKSHPTLGRSRFWRSDVHWYGTGPNVDMRNESRTLAYHLSGDSQHDADLYVMINAYWEPLEFQIQEGTPGQWRRVVDTSLPSPGDICEPGSEPVVSTNQYTVQARSVVVLIH